MMIRFMATTIAFVLFVTPSPAQSITDETPKSDLLTTYVNYARENLGLIASTAAIASGITAGLFLVFGRARLQNVDVAQQRREALALLAAATQIVHPADPHLGGGELHGDNLPRGSDSLTRSALLRPQVQQDELLAIRSQPEQETQQTHSSTLRDAHPTAISTVTRQISLGSTSAGSILSSSSSTRSSSLSRASSGSQQRQRGSKPVVSAAVETLESLVARLSEINSASSATALREQIVAHIQAMTPREIGEAAQAAFFWDKLLSEPQGYLFFIALTADQLKAALASIVVIWPMRGTIDLIDVVDDRLAYLLQPIGNAIEHCIERHMVDILLLQLRAIVDQQVLTLQRTDLDVRLRRGIQSHAKFEKNMRSILGKLKVSCKDNPAFADIAAVLLPQLLEIEERLKASLKMELPLQLDTDPK